MRARRRRSGWLGWALLVAVVALVAAGCAVSPDGGELPQNALDPAGPIAREQDQLWRIVFPIATVIFFLVQGGLIYLIVRYRSRDTDGAAPQQVHGNTRLEVAWTIIPALILAFIAVPTVRTIFQLSSKPDDALEVRVIGKQYWFEFEYLGDEGQGVVTANELHIPTGRPVLLQMESLAANVPDPGEVGAKTGPAANGVIHSFWVPKLAGKQDLIPGHVRTMVIEADEPGRYAGQCAEFCGISHANMRFAVVAEEAGDFEDWLAAQAGPAAEAGNDLAAQGRELFEARQCNTCHAIEGHPADAGVRIGPNLTHFADRQTFAGGIFENNDENLAAWLENPPAVKPGAQMPRLGLSEEDIRALVAYLRTLE